MEPHNGTFNFWGAGKANGAPFYLFFDTETTGLPKDWKAPVTKLDNWPRLIQIAWVLYDEEGNTLEERSYIVKPDGFEIPKVASDIHGITTEMALREGRPLVDVLKEFSQVADKAKRLVAHNMSYDIMIIHAELLRNGLPCGIEKKVKICTKESSTNFCAIDGPYGYKWPKLNELYMKLFNEELKDAHDALVDVKATAKCFWEMKKRGVI
ncbi:MAG TPA: 3'-5' exonuclease [Candidatus Paceibacterota bacterium]|nr:3'-5' exonuclease [Candidatus Paceibacterota bacterium]